MSNDVKLLSTIINYCNKIENATKRFGNDKNNFLNDFDYQHTCSFSIAQIGESVKNLSQRITEGYTEVPWRNISGMRDIIAHGYGGINLNTIWITIQERIPELKEACEKILYELERS